MNATAIERRTAPRLRAIYPRLDAIPERYRELFSNRGGKWLLTRIDGLRSDADVERLRRAAEKERNAHRQTREELDALRARLERLEPDENIDASIAQSRTPRGRVARAMTLLSLAARDLAAQGEPAGGTLIKVAHAHVATAVAEIWGAGE